MNNKKYKRKWKKDNPEKVKEYKRKYNQSSKGKENNQQYHRKYRKTEQGKENCRKAEIKYSKSLKGKERSRKYDIKRSQNPIHLLNRRIKDGIRRSLKGNKAGKHWENLVGWKLQDLLKHYGRLPDPTEHNDHRIPLSFWNFISPECPEFKCAWAINNLQLLESNKNLSKSDKVNIDTFAEFCLKIFAIYSNV